MVLRTCLSRSRIYFCNSQPWYSSLFSNRVKRAFWLFLSSSFVGSFGREGWEVFSFLSLCTEHLQFEGITKYLFQSQNIKKSLFSVLRWLYDASKCKLCSSRFWREGGNFFEQEIFYDISKFKFEKVFSRRGSEKLTLEKFSVFVQFHNLST